MILQIDDWKFDIDMEKTMEYSASEAKEHCSCAYCRNFYAAVDRSFPEFRPFLAQFGLDAEAPEEMNPVFYEDGSILYDPRYLVFGRILRYGSYEMEAGFCHFVARTEGDETDHFYLDCYEVLLQWTLDEPLDAVISPAPEPSWLGKAIKKWSGRAGKSDIFS